jgi:hypothetical protein
VRGCWWGDWIEARAENLHLISLSSFWGVVIRSTGRKFPPRGRGSAGLRFGVGACDSLGGCE